MRCNINHQVKAKTFAVAAMLTLGGAITVFSQNWALSSATDSDGWMAVACSADGNRLFAISAAGLIYATSTNAGSTWATNAEPQWVSGYSGFGSWDCIASSADGNTLLGMNYNGVWVSTNGGISWASNTVPGVNHWTSVALSADGTKAVAVDGDSVLAGGDSAGGIYTSTNSGMSWTETSAPIKSWSSVASSADGSRLAAVGGFVATPFPVYVSTNFGVTWNATATPTNLYCDFIVCSADGHKLATAGYAATSGTSGSAYTPVIYTSTDTGNTWLSNNIPFLGVDWYGLASSADCSTLIACSEGNTILLTSTNSGATWISNSLPASLFWVGAASSADGSKLVATYVYPGNGGIYTSQTTPAPQLNSSLVNGNFALSWLVPSTNFVLQQCSDLTGANWCTMTNTPLLNFSNLQYQVTAPASAGSAFYRLKTQ